MNPLSAATSRGPGERFLRLWPLAIAVQVAVGLALVWPFTAEDSYISYRYARNLAQGFGPVFNLGERINAMTSPLHVLISSGLYLISSNLALLNKVMGILLFAASLTLVARAAKGNPSRVVVSLALAALPPFVLLWTVGGLETPILFSLTASMTSLVFTGLAKDRPPLLAMSIVAALAFLTRYDSVLFFGPVVVWAALRDGRIGRTAMIWLACALPVIGWLAFAQVYFGDFFPTPFHVKTPGLGKLPQNLAYILLNLTIGGFTLLFLPFLFRLRRLDWRVPDVFRTPHFILWFATALILAYGLTMATVHMMFGFRFFVPYVPVAAVLVGRLFVKYAHPRSIAPALVALSLLSAAGLARTVVTSVDGLSWMTEYPRTGVTDYAQFMSALERNARDTARDAATRQWSQPPRFYTYAAGMAPYHLPNFHIFEGLVSYRPGLKFDELKRQADYIQTLSPRHGPLAGQLCYRDAVRVSHVPLFFDGVMESFDVYYLPREKQLDVHRPCPVAFDLIRAELIRRHRSR